MRLAPIKSEEKVALVGFPFRPAMSAEANLLGIVSTEFIAEKLAICRAPRLHLSVHNRQTFAAECAVSRYVFPDEAFTHLLSLTPIKNPILSAWLYYQTHSRLTVPKMTHF
jgi:hypothetical protein